MTIEYKFKEGEEDKPVEERTIVKSGVEVEFTMVAMNNDDNHFNKALKELKANRDLKKGVVDNIEQHHPFVKDFSEMDLSTLHMYHENKKLQKAFDDKIVEIEGDYKKHLEEKEEIRKQIPVVLPVISPYVKPAVVEGGVVGEEEKINDSQTTEGAQEEGKKESVG